VSAHGGEPKKIASIAPSQAGAAVRYPAFLPDNQHFLYLHLSGDEDAEGVYVGSLSGEAPKRLFGGGYSAADAPSNTGGPGLLLFLRQEVLMAQAFDPAALEMLGNATPVASDVGSNGNTGHSAISISRTGVLAHGSTSRQTYELAWRDRSGTRKGTVETMERQGFSLAPDGQRVAFSSSQGGKRLNILLRDLPTGATATFSGPSGPGFSFPTWSPDGSELAFATIDIAGLGNYEILRKPVNTAGAEQVVFRSEHLLFPWDWSPDGRFLVFTRLDHDEDLLVVPLTGGDPTAVAVGPGDQTLGQFSPDGRWIAYASDEGGGFQVYVRSHPDGGSLQQISTAGGTEPRWSRDGSELYFRTQDDRLMVVRVHGNNAAGVTNTTLGHGPVKELFDGLQNRININRFSYQPSSDGQRFLVRQPPGLGHPVTVVLNWQAGLKR
jgi:dipeptidyl aminopeptidase/acylaminoacyl peptidase